MSKKDSFITVTGFNNLVKDALIGTFTNQIKIKGEISNIKSSGPHTYLTLKDENSTISVVSWNSKFDNLKNGDDVLASGKITCFLKSGSYQINASKIEKIGAGLLNEILEKNKNLFKKKGYFSKSERHIPLPSKINRIGILTASEGAALQDILYVLKSNLFNGEVCIKNCAVQGQSCPKSVSNGIEYFNDLHKKKHIDVLIVARGGGSFEDLMGFSSKEIVKSIYKTKIYTISAIGHEVDTMLSDFTANCRAPTPSVAGELISSVQKTEKDILRSNLENLSRLKLLIKNKLFINLEKINSEKKLLKSVDPVSFINSEIDKFSRIKTFIHSKISSNFNDLQTMIEKHKMKNEMYNPKTILENGYVAVVDDDNNLVNSIKEFETKFQEKQKLKIIFIDGELDILSLINKKHVKK
jgi:exodeoxyribonuclease VII large subunit